MSHAPVHPLDVYPLADGTLVTHSHFISEKLFLPNETIVTMISQHFLVDSIQAKTQGAPILYFKFNRQHDTGEEWAEVNRDAFEACFLMKRTPSSLYLGYQQILEEFDRAVSHYDEGLGRSIFRRENGVVWFDEQQNPIAPLKKTENQ